MLTGREFLRKYLAREVSTQGCYGVFERKYLRHLGGMKQLGTGLSPYSDNLLAIRVGLLDKVVYIDAPLVFLWTHDGAISFASPDVDAYTSAQEDLCRDSVALFQQEALRDDFQSNLLSLLRWCLGDFYSVLGRSAGFQGWKVLRYLLFLSRYGRLLGIVRYTLALMSVRSTVGYIVRIARRRLGRTG